MVPVVLLTGFLGSGKTTLLNRMLAQRQASAGSSGRLAILVNELGAVGIDGTLLPPGAARQVELPGGCICCSLDENLEISLLELLARERDLELVLIETTGIAEPLPILWTLTGEALAGLVRVAAVVTVVDALEHDRHRPLAPAVDNQVEHADILVLSKLDAFDPGDASPRTAELEGALRARCPDAALVAERDAAASAAAVWALLADPSLERAAPPGIVLAQPQHRHGFEAIALPIHGTLDLEELTSQLEALPPAWVRIKGIAWTVDESTGSREPRLTAFHRVGARVSAEPIPPGRTIEPCAVALGIGIAAEADRLTACLESAMIKDV